MPKSIKLKKPSDIRPVFFSMKWKGTILIFVLFIMSISILFQFIINYENSILNKQMDETMNVYLETFKKDVEVMLLEKKDRDGLNSIIQSYRNITNFIMAMFVDNTGNVIVHTDVNSVNKKISSSRLSEFKKVYEDKVYFSEYEDVQKNILWYYGYKPVYHPHIAKAEFKKMNDFIELYQSGKLFKNEILPEETRNNFRMIKEFEDLASPYQNRKGAQPQIKITQSDRNDINIWLKRWDNYKKTGSLQLTDKEFLKLKDLLKKLGWSDKKANEFTAIRQDKKKVFNNKIAYNEEEKNNIRFIAFIKSYLSAYMDEQNNLNKNFDQLVEKLTSIDYKLSYQQNQKKNQRIEDSLLNKDNCAAAMKDLLSDYKGLEKYRYSLAPVSPVRIEKILSDFKNIYRIGTIRIVFDLNQVRLDQKTIINNVINIAIMVVLRLFAITYFIVSLLIFPLSVLSAGTDEIAKGNLDKIIQVRSRDEIGQLADKFNFMSKSLKKAFNEIKDKARMEAELKNAQEIQEAILPKAYPQIEKFSFSTYYQPETESGGDYYDFIDVDDKHFGVVIADVTGHGVGAGIVMSMLRSHLRTAAVGKKDTSEVIKEINPILYRDTLPNMFATIFYAVVDISTNILYYTNAGHHPAIIYNPKEPKAKLLRTGGMPIGMVDSTIFDPSIELHQIQLKKGDYCIAYTDGIIEAKSKENNEYGEEKFYASISRHSSENLDHMRDGIIGDLKKFTEGAEQSDDITLIIIKTNS